MGEHDSNDDIENILGPIPENLQIVMDKNVQLLNRKGGVQGLAREMETDLDIGAKSSSIDYRRKKWGENSLPEQEEVTLLDKIWEQFEDPMVQLLMVAAIVSLLLHFTVGGESGGWIEGCAILASVCIVASVSAMTEYNKELKFKELSAARPTETFNVRRDDKLIKLLETEIVQGDVVQLRSGHTAPTDGIFIEGQDAKVDESATTGENVEICLGPEGREQFIISGSSILEGECFILVTGVGINSLSGRAEMRNRQKKDATPLQLKLEDLTETITKMGIFMACLTSLTLFAKVCLAKYTDDTFFEWIQDYPDVGRAALSCATVGITIIVVAVPEGLPLSVTIALAYSMKKMMDDNNLVRHLAACETMGGATQICSDKTGTLTQNKMTVVQCLFAGDRRPRPVPVPSHVNYASGVAVCHLVPCARTRDHHTTPHHRPSRSRSAPRRSASSARVSS